MLPPPCAQILPKRFDCQILLPHSLVVAAHAVVDIIQQLQGPVHSFPVIAICDLFDIHGEKHDPDR